MNYRYYVVVIALGMGACVAESPLVRQARAEFAKPGITAQQFDRDFLKAYKTHEKGQAVQITVENQCTGIVGLEGSLQTSSCAYHAIKNGILCALAILNSAEREEYLRSMISGDYSRLLFGLPASPWRLEIMKARFQSVARKVYRKQIARSLKKSRSAERRLIKHCIKNLLPLDPIQGPEGFRYRADKEQIYAQLTERMNTMIRQGSKHAGMLKSLLDCFNHYFEDTVEVNFAISLDGRCYDPHNPTKTLGTVQGDQYGTWVTSSEITCLADYQRTEGLMQTCPSLLVATYGDDIGGHDDHAYASENLAKLYAVAHETEDDLIGVVLVYLSSQYEETWWHRLTGWFSDQKSSFAGDAYSIQHSYDRGHWVACVISRINKGMQYYVLDSVNSDRVLAHPRVQDLIQIFNGKKELPGYQWTRDQVGEAVKKKSFLLRTRKWLAATVGLGGLTWYAYHWYRTRNQR